MIYPFLFGYNFNDRIIFEKALTHRSYYNENIKKSPGDNEKLEFLGDSVIDLLLSQRLMERFPNLSEGELSKLRASLVNESSLASLARNLDLGQYIKLGVGESKMGGSQKSRLLASVFEAIVGALYLDGGLTAASDFLKKQFEQKIEEFEPSTLFQSDYKTRLQEFTQKNQKITPVYQLVNEEGPDHSKVFEVMVKVGTDLNCKGQGKTKKLSLIHI